MTASPWSHQNGLYREGVSMNKEAAGENSSHYHQSNPPRSLDRYHAFVFVFRPRHSSQSYLLQSSRPFCHNP